MFLLIGKHLYAYVKETIGEHPYVSIFTSPVVPYMYCLFYFDDL